eukprot:TRINITY_DN45548_c0_g1_i1.p1 TRINITY_DN45548_c0_g1~~TRINITY_DN45548_c0_g1_i1.p1  ORF type:complete len:502 (-),score=57.09 TRINITY_DN45548_c0_g1_i1:141-1646(-)
MIYLHTGMVMMISWVVFAPFAAAYPALQHDSLNRGYPVALELYYEQKLDHFNPADQRRWPQRYLMNKDSWDGRGRLANGCPGPVLLYTGNEGPITAFWELSGFVVDVLASKLGGLVLFPEERFYGTSLPFGNRSFEPANIRFLTTAQVLEDIVEIVDHVKQTVPDASTCPVVAFGGSYGGTLTALLRASHPATIVGGLAASSELGYYDLLGWQSHGVDQFTFEDVVVSTWENSRPGCLNAVMAALQAIDKASESSVMTAFNVCDARVLGKGPKSTLFAYVLEGMPQGDYPSLGYPVTKACDALLAARASDGNDNVVSANLVAVAGQIANTFYGSPSCVSYDVGGPGNVPGDGPSPSAWGYQSCTEALHAFSARTFRNYTFDLDMSTSLCGLIYNDTVEPDLFALAREFGGAYALAEGTAGVSNLIWSQGTLDPWHGWFKNISKPAPQLGVHHILMEGSAHHTDLRSPSDADPPSVVHARRLEESIIRTWIEEATGAPAIVV